MAVIDAHVHLYPEVINGDPAGWAQANGEPLWSTLCTRIRKNGTRVQDFPSVEALLREMDAAGVDRAVLLGWYWEKPDNCRMQNDFFSTCLKSHPDRLRAFAALHPGAGEGWVDEEIRRAVERGFSGFGELSPHSQGIAATDPRWQALLETVRATGLPVNLHVTESEAPRFPGRVETPLEDFVSWARRYPDVRFILAHLGARLRERIPEATTLPNVYFDLAATPLIYPGEALWEHVRRAGMERVLFGTDFPLNLEPRSSGRATLATFVRETARVLGADSAVLASNAEKLGL